MTASLKLRKHKTHCFSCRPLGGFFSLGGSLICGFEKINLIFRQVATLPTSRKTYRNDNVKISINGYTLLGLLISALRVECKASETLHIHLGLAIRTQDAVLFLLNIGELSIDITLTVHCF